MMIDYLIWIIPYSLACYGIAMWGGNRTIGFSKAILISFFLTPIVGLIVVMNSKKAVKEEKTWKTEQIPDGYPEKVRIEYSNLLSQLREGEISKEEFERRKAELLSGK
jgi:uncharacterized membrane protein